MYIQKPKYAIGLLLISCLLIFGGCRFSQKANVDLKRWSVSDPNLLGINIVDLPDGSKYYNYKGEFHSDKVNTIPLWKREYSILEVPVVKGSINGNTYPVLFDTGNSINATIIEDIHVRQNNLPIILFNNQSPKSGGMAMIDEFRVGTLYGTNYPCYVFAHHTQVKLLGIPVTRSRHVIIPLTLMAKFNYFEFDQVQNTVRFSADTSFEPADELEWIQFPFKIQDNQILLTLHIEGIEATMFLDTGAGLQLELKKSVVEHLYQARPELENVRKRKVKLFGPYADGNQAGKKFPVPTLKLDSCILDDVEIIYDTKSFEETPYQGMIGFELFEDTILVLDFEKNIMWVKKAGRFN